VIGLGECTCLYVYICGGKVWIGAGSEIVRLGYLRAVDVSAVAARWQCGVMCSHDVARCVVAMWCARHAVSPALGHHRSDSIQITHHTKLRAHTRARARAVTRVRVRIHEGPAAGRRESYIHPSHARTRTRTRARNRLSCRSAGGGPTWSSSWGWPRRRSRCARWASKRTLSDKGVVRSDGAGLLLMAEYALSASPVSLLRRPVSCGLSPESTRLRRRPAASLLLARRRRLARTRRLCRPSPDGRLWSVDAAVVACKTASRPRAL
jgi:hypothetical protein